MKLWRWEIYRVSDSHSYEEIACGEEMVKLVSEVGGTVARVGLERSSQPVG